MTTMNIKTTEAGNECMPCEATIQFGDAASRLRCMRPALHVGPHTVNLLNYPVDSDRARIGGATINADIEWMTKINEKAASNEKSTDL